MADRTVEAYIAALDEPRRATATRLREVIRAAVPDARESIKWAQPVYEDHGPFAAMKAFPKHVTLTFWRGAALAGSAEGGALLTGDGDVMRHVRFHAPDEIPAADVTALVRAAAALNRELGDPTKRRG